MVTADLVDFNPSQRCLSQQNLQFWTGKERLAVMDAS